MTQEEQNILSQLNDAQRQAVVYDDGCSPIRLFGCWNMSN